jgi:hypothetical protein
VISTARTGRRRPLPPKRRLGGAAQNAAWSIRHRVGSSGLNGNGRFISRERIPTMILKILTQMSLLFVPIAIGTFIGSQARKWLG